MSGVGGGSARIEARVQLRELCIAQRRVLLCHPSEQRVEPRLRCSVVTAATPLEQASVQTHERHEFGGRGREARCVQPLSAARCEVQVTALARGHQQWRDLVWAWGMGMGHGHGAWAWGMGMGHNGDELGADLDYYLTTWLLPNVLTERSLVRILSSDIVSSAAVAWHVWCGVAWCGVVWRGVRCGVVWCGVVWRGVAWRGVAWREVCRGVVWRGVAWRGVA